jgi:ABC-type uncharacterized transport system substrate-binding protein
VVALLLVVLVLAAPIATAAPPATKVARVGWLSGGSERQNLPYVEAFRGGLRDLGYVEGRSVVIEYRWSEGSYERLPQLAAEFVAMKVDVILAQNAPAVQAAREATRDIPIVMTVLLDPVAAGLVASLAHPGGNITGLSMVAPELVGKQMELLKEVLPRLSRIGVLGNPANPGNAQQVREAEVAAQALGIRSHILAARSPSDIDTAFAAMARQRADAFIVLVDAMLGGQRERIARLAASHRLPSVSGLRIHAEAGDLLSYGANRVDIHRRSAEYVGAILKGSRPAEMPIEQPKKFELVVNRKTARALGLTIPPSVLLRADHVIQ